MYGFPLPRQLKDLIRANIDYCFFALIMFNKGRFEFVPLNLILFANWMSFKGLLL